jgi:hypothetical protein
VGTAAAAAAAEEEEEAGTQEVGRKATQQVPQQVTY